MKRLYSRTDFLVHGGFCSIWDSSPNRSGDRAQNRLVMDDAGQPSGRLVEPPIGKALLPVHERSPPGQFLAIQETPGGPLQRRPRSNSAMLTTTL